MGMVLAAMTRSDSMLDQQKPRTHYTQTEAYKRAQARFEAERLQYAIDMRRLEEGGDDPYGNEPWIQAMQMLGRR